MDNLNEMEMRLWEYIDGFTQGEEKMLIEQLIREQADWKAKYAELLQVHQSIDLVELEEPSMRFTRNVMEEIAKFHIAPATKSYINNKVVWGIGIFFITLIIGFVGYGIAQIDWTAASDSNSAVGVDFSQIDYSRMFNNNFVNVFMMLNVVLGLLLLDRYLTSKNKKLKDA